MLVTTIICGSREGHALWIFQNFPNLEGQFIEFKWLLNKTITSIFDHVSCLPIHAVTTGQQNMKIGLDLFHLGIDFFPVHFRHDNVQYNEIDIGMTGRKDL